ncbi:fimbrial protein [Citrobacter braakii]|uniref:fimbrial protein n=1 Tax=Citrobacter braakii TaxID=57706 RepID=UPI003C2D1CCA|nr:type 1 fimbrial protein [Citrobacter freundii]
MKKNILAVMLASACGLSAMSANAADGTITFNGQITDTTCDVALSSPGATSGSNLVVELGAFHKAKITNANDVVSEKDVNFSLTNCPAAITKVGILFEGTQDNDMQDAFANAAGADAAVGVAVKLLDGASAVAPNSLPVLKDITNGTLEIPYKAQFVATKANADLTAGKYTTTVNYTMNYQ